MPLSGEPFAGPLPKPQSRAAEKKARDRATELQWRRTRQVVLVRDGYRCRACGTLESVDVHHITFRSAGREDSSRNCVAMCRCCHSDIHAYRLFIHGTDANKTLRFERVT